MHGSDLCTRPSITLCCLFAQLHRVMMERFDWSMVKGRGRARWKYVRIESGAGAFVTTLGETKKLKWSVNSWIIPVKVCTHLHVGLQVSVHV